MFLLMALPVAIYLWPSDETRIRKLIKEGALVVEREDLDGLMSKVSFNYRDEYGLSYLLLKDVIKREFGYYSDIDVEYENLAVRVDKDRATATLDLRVLASTGTLRGYIFGDLREPLRLKLELEKGSMRKWLVLNSSGFEGYKGGSL